MIIKQQIIFLLKLGKSQSPFFLCVLIQMENRLTEPDGKTTKSRYLAELQQCQECGTQNQEKIVSRNRPRSDGDDIISKDFKKANCVDIQGLEKNIK